MVDIRRPAFSPVEDPHGKPNSKRFYRIEPDGSVTERVYLHVPDIRERERLVCIHYLRHLVRHFIAADVGVRVLSRDDPWDFRIELSTGDLFNIEVTAIADNPQQFEINKREERLATYLGKEQISLRDLRKLVSWFPDPNLDAFLQEKAVSGYGLDQLVDNPLSTEEMRIFLSVLCEPIQSLENQLRKAIDTKTAKPHAEKNKTVLIIDNRTSAFDAPDYFQATVSLRTYLQVTPFAEIWFYTGYYSDTSGNAAEFSFAPLKISEEQERVLEKMIEHRPPDEHGRVIW